MTCPAQKAGNGILKTTRKRKVCTLKEGWNVGIVKSLQSGNRSKAPVSQLVNAEMNSKLELLE